MGQPASLCMRKPSLRTPRACTARSATVNPAPAVALSPAMGLMKVTFGPLTMRTRTRTVSALFDASVSTPVTISESVRVSIGVATRR